MIIPPHAELHYRTRLILRPQVSDGDARGEVEAHGRRMREVLRAWASARFPDAGQPLEADVFHAGRTKLVSLQPPGEVRTVGTSLGPDGHGGPTGRQLWAFQARLPDTEVRRRSWAHEVAIGPFGEGALRLSVRLHHWLEVGEVGWRAPRADPGPPSYLLEAVEAPDLEVTDGRDPVPVDPLPVPMGGGPDFVRHLADPDRRLAAIYVSVTGPDARPAVDPSKLAHAVALGGVVHLAESPDLDAELDHFLSQDLRCYGGALRIYRPGLNPRARGRREAERHRYIPRSRMGSRPLRDLLAEVAEEVMKSMPPEDPEREPVTFGEIEAMRSRIELEALREEAEALRKRSRGGLSAEDSRQLFRLNERLEDRVRTLEEENQRLAKRAFHASERLEEERETAGAAEWNTPPASGELNPDALVASLRELPRTPADALELASHLFPHRLLVTERARSAARDAPNDDAGMAWRILVAMAEDLHPLHFDDAADSRSALDIREAFGNRTRFDVAFTESKSTKASDRLRSLRAMRYDGGEVELLWHVKWGTRPPKLLRAYYHPDPERKLLVIDWFGDHLETAGTRRMS